MCHFALLSFLRMKHFYCFALFCGKSYCDICKISHRQTASACKHDVFKTGNKRTILTRPSVRPQELETISNFFAVVVYLTVEYTCRSLQHLRPGYPSSKYVCQEGSVPVQSCQEVRRTSGHSALTIMNKHMKKKQDEWNWLWKCRDRVKKSSTQEGKGSICNLNIYGIERSTILWAKHPGKANKALYTQFNSNIRARGSSPPHPSPRQAHHSSFWFISDYFPPVF